MCLFRKAAFSVDGVRRESGQAGVACYPTDISTQGARRLRSGPGLRKPKGPVFLRGSSFLLVFPKYVFSFHFFSLLLASSPSSLLLLCLPLLAKGDSIPWLPPCHNEQVASCLPCIRVVEDFFVARWRLRRGRKSCPFLCVLLFVLLSWFFFIFD